MSAAVAPALSLRAAASTSSDTDELAEVEQLMRSLARGDGPERDLAARMAIEQLASGGKRLRARLALHAGRALGCAARDGVAWAAAVELLHNGTLVHDDIQDGDAMRRGRPTVWAVHGTAQAINAGDLLLMLPYAALAKIAAAHRGALACAIAAHAVRIVRGQCAELSLLSRGELDWEAYTRAARGKTGALFGLTVHGAALLAGKGDAHARALGDSFVLLGLLFQLQDDVLDVYGDKGRFERASDLYEGKVSALVVAHLERRPADAEWLLPLLRAPRELTEESEVVHAIESFRESGALADVLAHIHALAEHVRSSAALAAAPALHGVASDLIERALAPIRDVMQEAP